MVSLFCSSFFISRMVRRASRKDAYERCRAMSLGELSLIAGAVLMLSIGNVFAQDWSSCASDLDDLRRRADDASTAAQDVDQKQRRFKSAEEEVRQCRQFPQIYDLLRDGCQTKRYELDSARSSYRISLDSLRGSLDDVDAKIRSAGSSCGFDLTRVLGPSPTVPNGVRSPEQCAIYLRYKGRLPKQSILEVCSKQMPLDECRKCLE